MAYMLRRFGFYLVAFWVSITLNFFLPRFMPGDPVSRMVARLQGQLRPDQIEALKESFGLSDAPLWEQYLRYLGQLFTGNLGFSISTVSDAGHRRHRQCDRLDPSPGRSCR